MTGAELKAQVDVELAINGGDVVAGICAVIAPYLGAGGKVTGLDGDRPLGSPVSDTEKPG